MDTNYYRRIGFLDSYYKILSLALLQRLEVYSKGIIENYQSSFLRGKSTSHHMFTIRQKMKNIFTCAILTLDKHTIDKLWITLEEFNIPKKINN